MMRGYFGKYGMMPICNVYSVFLSGMNSQEPDILPYLICIASC